jgi:hypothetical protein
MQDVGRRAHPHTAAGVLLPAAAAHKAAIGEVLEVKPQ